MQLLLSNTNHTLELESGFAGSLDYYICYVDLTTGAIANPLAVSGNITTATTTVILAAPAASTTRKVLNLSVYNKGTSTNTIKLKVDFGGTEFNLQKFTLQVDESLRVVNDKVSVFDSSGREKTQNTGDSEYGGDSRSLLKVGTAPEAAGQFYCFSKDTGYPGAWAPGTPGINGRNTDGTLSADNGCITIGVPASGSWYIRERDISSSVVGQFNLWDVLWINTGLSVTTLTAQTITQPTLPARDNQGSTNGLGVFAGLLVTTATTNGSAINNITISYTNSDGTAGRVGTMSAFPATAVIGTFVPFLLAAGDRGIRSIQSITIGTSLVTGAVSLICYNPIVTASCTLINGGTPNTVNKKLDLILYNGHCLLPFWIASGTGAVNISGTIYFVNK